jgi:hypothetical protein
VTKGNGTVKTPLQLSLFEEANSRTMQVAGLVSAIKGAMFRAARDSAMSREQITARMNDIALAAGVRMTQGRARIISQDTVDKWLTDGVALALREADKLLAGAFDRACKEQEA